LAFRQVSEVHWEKSLAWISLSLLDVTHEFGQGGLPTLIFSEDVDQGVVCAHAWSEVII